MTITYTGSVANARLFGFSRLLFYWKGSIYKLMYKEMVIFCSIYATLSLTYRLALDESQKRLFEKVALYCDGFSNLIPLSFVLGFYVSVCVGRWWNQYMSIPWPDRMMMYVTTMIDGADTRGKIIRRTIMRYLSLSSLIVFQATSVVVKKRFPTMEHLMDAGLITESEVNAMNEVQTPHGKWWVPFVWICNLIKAAHKEGRIKDTFLMKTLIDEVQAYRGNLGLLFSYDWISIPLVYTQVTTLATYIFFLSCVLGRQFLDPKMNYQGHEVDLYIPAFTILQFFFYMGWLKVAEQLINPFGEDDDDFEMNWVIDRNLQISLIVADDMFNVYPQPEKDVYFDEAAPDYLPYTKSTVDTIRMPHMGSTADLSVSCEGMKVVTPMETIQENQSTDNQPNHMSYYPDYHQTPMSSPANNRRLFPNMIVGCHTANGLLTPLNNSKSTLDGKNDIVVKVDGYETKVDIKHHVFSKPITTGYSSGKIQGVLDGLSDPSSLEQTTGITPLGCSADTALSSYRSKRASSPVNVPAIVIHPKCDSHSDPAKHEEHPESPYQSKASITPKKEQENGYISEESPPVKLDESSPLDAQLEDIVCESDTVPDMHKSPCKSDAQEGRFDVCVVQNDTYGQTSDAGPAHGLAAIIETERNRHSSDEQSVDYNYSNNSSISSFTPLLRHSRAKKDPPC